MGGTTDYITSVIALYSSVLNKPVNPEPCFEFKNSHYFQIFLHALAFVFGLLYAPQMFHHNELLGALCKEEHVASTWYQDSPSSIGGCTPVNLFDEVSSLEDLTISFRFPSEETKVSNLFVY